MKIERTKNAARNIAFDGLQKTVNMMIPFIMRTVISERNNRFYRKRGRQGYGWRSFTIIISNYML